MLSNIQSDFSDSKYKRIMKSYVMMKLISFVPYKKTVIRYAFRRIVKI